MNIVLVELGGLRQSEDICRIKGSRSWRSGQGRDCCLLKYYMTGWRLYFPQRSAALGIARHQRIFEMDSTESIGTFSFDHLFHPAIITAIVGCLL